ncbi:MAG TPA: HEAT repeat domain-containing protein [Desulfatiglandales bacterium]|nr:HEAT repeat domain-containing protein [Desulfatiglandales bacterium]
MKLSEADKDIHGHRHLKKEILELLSAKDFDQSLRTLELMPAHQVANVLLSFLPNTDLKIKWPAVTAIGSVVAKLADKEMESARDIMRRLMWQLNEESGGIGWGCPETMGEIMACHEGLAIEYSHMLISYLMVEGNYLEYEPLQQGVLWGLGRLAQIRPHLIQDAVPHLMPFLDAKDGTLKALAAWALGLLGAEKARRKIESLAMDETEIEIYVDRALKTWLLKDLAKEALKRIKDIQAKKKEVKQHYLQGEQNP